VHEGRTQQHFTNVLDIARSVGVQPRPAAQFRKSVVGRGEWGRAIGPEEVER